MSELKTYSFKDVQGAVTPVADPYRELLCNQAEEEQSYCSQFLLGQWPPSMPTTGNLARMEELLKNLNYKPGWRFRAEWAYMEERRNPRQAFSFMDTEAVRVWVQWDAPDASAAQQATSPQPLAVISNQMLFSGRTMAECTDQELVDRALRQLVVNCELHEVDEWLRYKGKCVREPHPEKGGKL